MRLGILASHPIQYYSPWFRFLAERIDIEVFYTHRQSASGQADAGFGVPFEWDAPLLDGYPYRWLRNVARNPSVDTFGGCDTPEVRRIVATERFDAFLIIGWNRKSAIQAVLACRQHGVPVLMRGDSHLATTRSWWRRTVKYLPYRYLLPRLDGHLYVGQRNLEYLRHYGVPDGRLFFAPHFVDNAYFANGQSSDEHGRRAAGVRRELGIPSDAFVVLFAGKLIEVKRPRDFVAACVRLVREDGANVHGLVVGDGPLRPELEAVATAWPGRIHFAGFRNQSEMPAFYRAAQALVLPGIESWGLVVNEAMACGRPAIVSDAAGCAPDLIEEGVTGYTYRVGDVDALCQRALHLRALMRDKREALCAAVAEKMRIHSVETASDGLIGAVRTVGVRKRVR